MDLLKEAFIEGYKQRAESSNLIFDNASRMYAISLFDKWKSRQLLLHNVSQQRELLIDFYSKQNGGMNDTNKHAIIREVDNYIESINCG